MLNEDELVNIPGLDIKRGLAFVGNKMSLYKKVLRKFPQRYGDFEHQFRELQASGDEAGAVERLAHSLKGVAATIGAIELNEAAKELEFACREERHNIEHCLISVSQKLAEVLKGISCVEECRDQDEAAEKQSINTSDIRVLLDDLCAYVHGAAVDVDAIINRLDTLLTDKRYIEDAEAIRVAVRENDRDELFMSIDILASKLHINIACLEPVNRL